MSKILQRNTFISVMFQDETIAEVTKDGLIYRFERETVEQKLNLRYDKDKIGWFFNNSRDRYCAEDAEDADNSILVNPSVVSTIFGQPVLFET